MCGHFGPENERSLSAVVSQLFWDHIHVFVRPGHRCKAQPDFTEVIRCMRCPMGGGAVAS